MKKLFITSLFLTLYSCSGENNKDEAKSRDLSDALTFSELIDLRMSNSSTLNGTTVLINDEVEAYFDQAEGCTENPAPCTEENYSQQIGEPTYQGTGVGACTGYGFALVGPSVTEKVNVNLEEHTEFFGLTGTKTMLTNFYAKIEFVERQAWCSDQINYGISITLKEGEEDHLLNQFAD